MVTGTDTFVFDLGLISPSIGLGSTTSNIDFMNGVNEADRIKGTVSAGGVLHVDKVIIEVQEVDTFRL